MAADKINNPFVNGLTIQYIQCVTEIKHTEGGFKEFGYNVEVEESIRLYSSARIRKFLYENLSMRARDYFTAIQYFTNRDYNYVVVTYDKMKELNNGKLSKRGYDDTIKELIKVGIIDCKNKANGQYWYNPAYFCAGNRLDMFKECAVKIKTSRVQKKLLV